MGARLAPARPWFCGQGPGGGRVGGAGFSELSTKLPETQSTPQPRLRLALVSASPGPGLPSTRGTTELTAAGEEGLNSPEASGGAGRGLQLGLQVRNRAVTCLPKAT